MGEMCALTAWDMRDSEAQTPLRTTQPQHNQRSCHSFWFSSQRMARGFVCALIFIHFVHLLPFCYILNKCIKVQWHEVIIIIIIIIIIILWSSSINLYIKCNSYIKLLKINEDNSSVFQESSKKWFNYSTKFHFDIYFIYKIMFLLFMWNPLFLTKSDPNDWVSISILKY